MVLCDRKQEDAMSIAQPKQDSELWYAIRVRSRSELLVSTLLRDKGYQEFLPLYKASHRWSDRVKQVDLPLFPGYLFCHLDAKQRLPILTTPGVISFVGAGKTPIPVSDDEVAAIRTIVRSGLAALPWPSLAAGQRILIERGPLAGLEGVALDINKKFRLVVSVPLLQRSVTVEIERSWIRPIRDLRHAGANSATFRSAVPASTSGSRRLDIVHGQQGGFRVANSHEARRV
jgi:transcription antitermination factor NusG